MNGRKIKAIIRTCIPPILLSVYNGLKKNRIRYRGEYASWEEARSKATGYDSILILEKVSEAMSKVKSGEAAFERDSVLFDKMEYPFPVLATLLRAASENDGALRILDFGGSLGSSYFQCRQFLSVVKDVQWYVVEQPGFVDRGKELFESDELKFRHTIEECLETMKPDVILLGSVLQYLPAPYAMLDKLTAAHAKYLVVDRTPMTESSKDRICVQRVAPEIYTASYPCTIFSESKLISYLSNDYALFAENTGNEKVDGDKFKFRSLVFKVLHKVILLALLCMDSMDLSFIKFIRFE